LRQRKKILFLSSGNGQVPEYEVLQANAFLCALSGRGQQGAEFDRAVFVLLRAFAFDLFCGYLCSGAAALVVTVLTD
jgi:hypothetical protein